MPLLPILAISAAATLPPTATAAPTATGTEVVVGVDEGVPPKGDPIDALVRRALDEDPTLAAAMARIRAADAAASLAGTPMSPMVSAEAMVGGMGMASVDLMAEQPLMAPGSLRAGRAMGRATISLADAEAEGAALALEGRIRASAAMYASAQARIALLTEARQAAFATTATARAMVTTGMGGTGEQAMVAMNVAAIDERLAVARQEAAMARATLARAVPDVPDTLPLGALPAGAPPPGDAPMVVIMEAMRQMAQANRDMARADRLPALTISGGVSIRTANMGGSMGIFGLSSDVPLYGRQRARLDAAVAALDAAGADIDAARREVAAEQAAMATDLDALRDRVDAARRMSQAARTQAESARSAYVHGQAGLEAWVAATQRVRDADEMEGMARAEALGTYATLAAMLGTSLLESP